MVPILNETVHNIPTITNTVQTNEISEGNKPHHEVEEIKVKRVEFTNTQPLSISTPGILKLSSSSQQLTTDSTTVPNSALYETFSSGSSPDSFTNVMGDMSTLEGSDNYIKLRPRRLGAFGSLSGNEKPMEIETEKLQSINPIENVRIQSKEHLMDTSSSANFQFSATSNVDPNRWRSSLSRQSLPSTYEDSITTTRPVLGIYTKPNIEYRPPEINVPLTSSWSARMKRSYDVMGMSYDGVDETIDKDNTERYSRYNILLYDYYFF